MTPAPDKHAESTMLSPSLRRGACPTLQHPMATGDGLLARLRPIDCRLTLPQMRAIAEAAERFGNGILEITARGSLQIRGLQPETVTAFERSVLETGLDIAEGVAVETPSLAGLDEAELVDVRPMAEAMRQRIAAHRPPLVLAPKLTVIIDGGGRFHLGHVSADIRVTAFPAAGGTKFLLSVGGTGKTARSIGVVDENGVIDAVIGVLETLAALGPAARGKDIDRPVLDLGPPALIPPTWLGLHDETILGVALTYRQTDSASLIAFIEAAEAACAEHIRLTPDHGFFVTGLTPGNARQLQKVAVKAGFRTEAEDPRHHIALCAGARGCASGFYDTRNLAEKLTVDAADLLDGSFDLHLSGCTKGCAHPAPALLTLAGARAGYALVVNGAASGSPSIYIAANDIDTVLKRLQALVRQSKEDGESVSACLARLGAGRVAAALQLDRT